MMNGRDVVSGGDKPFSLAYPITVDNATELWAVQHATQPSVCL